MQEFIYNLKGRVHNLIINKLLHISGVIKEFDLHICAIIPFVIMIYSRDQIVKQQYPFYIYFIIGSFIISSHILPVEEIGEYIINTEYYLKRD